MRIKLYLSLAYQKMPLSYKLELVWHLPHYPAINHYPQN